VKTLARSMLSLALLLAAALACPPARAGERLTILHLNDFHGWLLPYSPKAGSPEVGGAARLAGLVASLRDDRTLFVAAGDLMQGTPISNLFGGAPVIEAFNAMGLNASAAGNHEFDNGQEVFRLRAVEARFPFLAANVRGADWLKPSVVVTAGPLRVGLFGLVTPSTPVETHPRNVVGLEFADPVAAAREMVAHLEGRAELVVCLSHLGYDEDRKLAAAVPGIDVIVGGHSHARLEQPVTVGGTLIVQAFERGALLGRLDLEIDRGAAAATGYRLIPVDASAPADARVAALVEGYRLRLDARMSERVATADMPLEGAAADVRSRETNLGNLVADAMREAAGADAALTNAGGIRASIPAGEVTVGQVYAVLPFDNWTVSFRIPGRDLRAALETCLAKAGQGDGGFPQVSGMTVAYDASAPPQARVREVTVGGAPLDDERLYLVATNDFLAAGGNGLTAFAGREPILNDTGRLLRDLFVDYLRRKGSVGGAAEGRIRRLP
jgi:2',3'-cyclic-nucleotide 2'-phosphodiesterase (5'-nucleotidase family)